MQISRDKKAKNQIIVLLTLTIIAYIPTNGGGGCGGTFAPSLFLGCIGGFVF